MPEVLARLRPHRSAPSGRQRVQLPRRVRGRGAPQRRSRATARDRDRLDAARIDVRRPRRARPRGDRRRAREGSRRDRRCGWNVARDRSARVSDRVSRVAADARPRPRAQVQHAGPSGQDQHARAVLQGSASARDDSYGVHDRRPGQDRAVLHRAPRLHRKRLLSRPRLLLARRRVESSSRPVLDQRRQAARASITSRSSSARFTSSSAAAST